MFLPRSSLNVPRHHKTLTFCSLLTWCTIPCACDASTSKSGAHMWCFVDFDLETRFAPPCTFSTSQLRRVVRHWCALYILTWKCASRHNSVQFFISHLASWLGTRRFSEPIFRPSGATNHWKNTVLRDFPTFSRWIFFLLRLSFFDLLSSSLLFSDSSHLCFSSVHIVGSLTSKLPSMISDISRYMLYCVVHQCPPCPWCPSHGPKKLRRGTTSSSGWRPGSEILTAAEGNSSAP